jgi:hypothetical protein
MRSSTVATAVCLALGLPLLASASSHREAPNITRFPSVDSTDFYLFRSYEPGREDYVTLLANYLPLQDPYGGPNYFALDPAAVYEIHVDNDGDAVEDLTFQFRFSNRLANRNRGIALEIGEDAAAQTVAVPLKNVGTVGVGNTGALNFIETYGLTLVRGERRKGQVLRVANRSTGTRRFGKPYDFVGTKTFGSVADYESYARQFVYDIDVPGCAAPGRVFAGQRREGFAVNLGRVFDLVNLVPVEGDSAPGAGDGRGFPGGITQSAANNQVADKNVTTLALELPVACLTGSGNGVIGAWTSASLRVNDLAAPSLVPTGPEAAGGPWTQVSRLSMPLVNELVIGLPDKDRFSASVPRDDGQFAAYVTNPTLPALLDLLFRDAVNSTLGTSIANLAPQNYPRFDLVTAFLTGFPGVNQQSLVTPSEMQRLNTALPVTPRAAQSPFGVVGDDLGGFPNGRRPGDDVVDIALRVVMGRLCHPVPVGGQPVELKLCSPADAPVGGVPFTDGAPVDARDFDDRFPYLTTPLPGATN